MKSQTSVKCSIPVKVSDLAEFIAAVPADAELTVTTFTAGQRDPYPTAYTFIARWTKGTDDE